MQPLMSMNGVTFTKPVLTEYLNPSVAVQTPFMEDVSDAFGNKAKTLHMKGLMIQGEVRNHNQRIYPLSEIKKAVDDINSRIKQDISILGEIDHPSDLKINLDRVSHQIVEMWMEGPNGFGKIKILPTPMGNIVKTMIEAGVKLGVSSRGTGNVDETTGRVSDFEIVTIDVVATPSAPQAFPVPVYESLMNMPYGYKTLELAKEANADIRNDARIQKYLRESIIGFIQKAKLK